MPPPHTDSISLHFSHFQGREIIEEGVVDVHGAVGEGGRPRVGPGEETSFFASLINSRAQEGGKKKKGLC